MSVLSYRNLVCQNLLTYLNEYPTSSSRQIICLFELLLDLDRSLVNANYSLHTFALFFSQQMLFLKGENSCIKLSKPMLFVKNCQDQALDDLFKNKLKNDFLWQERKKNSQG